MPITRKKIIRFGKFLFLLALSTLLVYLFVEWVERKHRRDVDRNGIVIKGIIVDKRIGSGRFDSGGLVYFYIFKGKRYGRKESRFFNDFSLGDSVEINCVAGLAKIIW